MGPLAETNVWIAVNGVRRISLTCAPHDRTALALGYLLAEGWVADPAGVLSLQEQDGPGGACGVAAEINEARLARALRLREHRLAHGCGLRHIIDCEPPQRVERAAPAADGSALFRELYAAADRASPEGGVHAAGLSDGSALLHATWDVARHCALDRAIGLGALAGADLSRLGLAITSRISGAIAFKCATAGVAWVASRSVATALAHEIAAASGLVLVERAARRERA